MPRNIRNKKGLILLVVVGTVMTVIILAGAILSTMLSHSRLTLHQLSRIQAYYAGQAGVNYALDMIRTGSWTIGVNCTSALGGCNWSDTAFPATIVSKQVNIVITPLGSGNCTVGNVPTGAEACISATAIFTYTP